MTYTAYVMYLGGMSIRITTEDGDRRVHALVAGDDRLTRAAATAVTYLANTEPDGLLHRTRRMELDWEVGQPGTVTLTVYLSPDEILEHLSNG